jgi:hypothetical protein
LAFCTSPNIVLDELVHSWPVVVVLNCSERALLTRVTDAWRIVIEGDYSAAKLEIVGDIHTILED